MNVCRALEYHLRDAGVIKIRFSLEGNDNHVLLELRTLDKILVDLILNKSFPVEVSVSENYDTCELYDFIDGAYSLSDKWSNPINNVGLKDGSDEFSDHIICNKVSDIEKFANIYFNKLYKVGPHKVLIFTRANCTNLLHFKEIYEIHKGSMVLNVMSDFEFIFSPRLLTSAVIQASPFCSEVTDSKIFIVKEDGEKRKTIFLSRAVNSNKPILCFLYLTNNKKEWIKEYCRLSITETGSNLLCESSKIRKQELFEQIEKINKGISLLTEQEGWGQSQTLYNIANMIERLRSDRYLMFFSMDEFSRCVADVEKLEDAAVTVSASIILKNKIKKELVKIWLRFRGIAKFIFHDPNENELKVTVILDIISKKFMSAPLWIFTRNSLMDSLKSVFPALVANLDSKTTNETIDFFNGKLIEIFQIELVRSFANRIIHHLGKRDISDLKCRLTLEQFEIMSFINTKQTYPCLFDMFCDVLEIDYMKISKNGKLQVNPKIALTSSISNTPAENARAILLYSLWLRNYKLSQLIIENAFKTCGLHESQHLSGKGYGPLHIVILSLTYALPDQDIPELSQIQAFLQFIVARDPDLLEQRDSQGQTPLLLLLREADSIIVDCKSLLQFFITDLKADINVCDNNNKTALHFQLRDTQSSLSNQVPNQNLFSMRVSDRSKLQNLYMSLWEILYENGLQRNVNQPSSNSLAKLPFSSVKILGVSRKYGICFYKIRGAENTDVFIINNRHK